VPSKPAQTTPHRWQPCQPSYNKGRPPAATVQLQQLWQPPGGDLSFVLKLDDGVPADAIVRVCFGWFEAVKSKTSGVAEARVRNWLPSPLVKLQPTSEADGSREYAAMMPALPDRPGYQSGYFTALGLVPKADMRVIVVQHGTLLAEETREVGVTSIPISLVVVLLLVAAGYVALVLMMKGFREKAGDPLLRLIANKSGWASLSQFQMLLWTFVISASLIYVMSLSGVLIDVPNGMLALLGISGAAAVGTQIHDANQRRALQQTFQTQNYTIAPRPPEWSDLVMGDGEVDVSRVQMLFFTLISAAYVLIRIVSSYTLPDIPDGVVILMGVSNGVYFTAKVAGGSNPQTPAGGLVSPAPEAGPPK
jgi:hypothetical protein